MTEIKNSAHFADRNGAAERAGNRDTAEPIPESLCRRHIERIAGSVTFGRAEQLRQLLKWLADCALEGSRTAPSEKEIAAAVLNRKDFDPQTDSLVRKEMSRLREKLTRYYMSEGRQDEIHVTGSGYLLGFERWGHANSARGTSCWLMLPFRSNSSLADQSEELLEELLMAFGERGGAELVASTTAMAYRGRLGDVRQFAAECSADFVVEGSLRRRNDLLEAMVWLIAGQSGRAISSKRITGSSVVDLSRSATAWLLEEDGGRDPSGSASG